MKDLYEKIEYCKINGHEEEPNSSYTLNSSKKMCKCKRCGMPYILKISTTNEDIYMN